MVRKNLRSSLLIRGKILTAGQSPVFGSAKDFTADKKGMNADARRCAKAVQTVPD
jgi:hypothetical protein